MTSDPDLLGDRYELGAALGRGGMADVVRAHDRVLHRTVAVKLLRGIDEVERERFAGEARLLAMLNHPNVVTVLDAGVAGDRPWLVLELVDGVPLDELLARDRPDPRRWATIGAGVAAALAHAHAHGIVHRDVKPSNVLVAAGDRPKLTDFGIVRLAGSQASLTLTGHTIGTAAYLAPEQVAGEAVSTPADVYALGLVLLEGLTGRREYDGPPVEAALARLQRSPLVAASLPPGWAGLVSTMTAREPADRPSAAEVVLRLEVLAGRAGAPGPAPVTAPVPVPVVAPVPVTAVLDVAPGPPVARRRRVALVAVAGLVALLLGVGYLAAAGGEDGEPAAGSTGSPSPSASEQTTRIPRPSATARATNPPPSSVTPDGPGPATSKGKGKSKSKSKGKGKGKSKSKGKAKGKGKSKGKARGKG